jgi:urea transport system substrate-binding protein
MKIGLLHCRDGVSGMWAPAKDAACAVAAAEINARGGVLGKEMELVIADCGSSNRQALEAVDTLIKVHDVDAIVGCHLSSIRDAVSNRLAGRLPYIYTAQYEGVLCGPSTIATGPQDGDLLAPALRWLQQEKGAQRFFFVGNDYVWPHMAFDTTWKLLAEQGGGMVGAAILPMQVQDYGELLTSIAQSDAQVVVLALLGQASVDFNRAFALAGLDDRILRFGLLSEETVVCATGAEASQNLYTAGRYFAQQRSQFNDRFLETYHSLFGEYAPPVSSISVGCYHGVHLVADLARELCTKNSRDIARHLARTPEKRPSFTLIDAKAHQIYMASANGVLIEVVANLSR